MASRRHHHDHGCLCHKNHRVSIPQVATSSRCCCTQFNHPSPPPEDNLLHLVASYIQNQQQVTQCPNRTCSCENSCQSFNGIRYQHLDLRQQKNVPREYDNIVLSCLLRKIDELESSLNKFSACYDQRRDRYPTLRDSAARVIQTHFRSYLVRRSISFRQLKELATIKSSFSSLKSSVSGKPIFPFKAVSRKATDLLLQLDSIQGRIDPMIRNSKRSLSRDLVRFLQYIDDCVVQRYAFVGNSAINVSFTGGCSKLNGKKPQGCGVAEDRTIEKLRNRQCKTFLNDIQEKSVKAKIFVTSSEDEDNNVELEDMTDDGEEVPINSIDKRKIGSPKSRTGAFVKGKYSESMVFDKNRNVYDKNRNAHDLVSSAVDDSVNGDEETLLMSRDNGKRHSLKTRNLVYVKESGGKTNRVVKTVSFDENGNVCKVYGDTPEASISEEDDSTSGSNDRNGEAKRVLVKGSGGKTTRVVKTVSFDENGNLYKVYGDTPESSISEEDDSTSVSDDGNGEEKGNGNDVEEIKYVPPENKGFEEEDEREEEETNSDNEVSSSEGSEGDAIVTRKVNYPGSNEHKREITLQKGSLMFYPPLPLKMEP